MPAELEDVWPCYQLVVVERVATWGDVTEKMSVDDVDLMVLACDATAAAREAAERAAAASGQGGVR